MRRLPPSCLCVEPAKKALTSASALWWADSNPSRVGGHDGPLHEHIAVKLQDKQTDGALLLHRHSDETQDAGVREPAEEHQLAKVFVAGDEDATLPVGVLQDGRVARIWAPVAGPDDIVAGCLELVASAVPDACVE